jgi:hypothetical protein
MKLLPVFFAVSVALNLALAGWMVLGPSKESSAVVEPSSEGERAKPATVASGGTELGANRVGEVEDVGDGSGSEGKRFTWHEVESADYREYVANLRYIGCPEETIRDIIRADVKKLFEEKKRQARGGPRKFEYWKASGNPMAAMLGDPETRQRMEALEKEKAEILKALGIEPDPMQSILEMAVNPMDTMFDFLTDDKKAQVMSAMADMQKAMADVAGDVMMDGEGILKAQRDMEAAIREVLTPEEFRDYQLRFSMTANMMRQQLGAFGPNEEEFLSIFELREAFDQEYLVLGMGNPTEAEQRQRAEAEAALKEQIKATLGEARYAEYERSQDYEFQQMHRVVERAGLDPGVAVEVYDMKQVAQEEANKVRMNGDMDASAKQAALLAIRQETERAFQEKLGEEAWGQYNRPNTTWWLRNMAPELGESGASPTVVHEATVVVPGP